MLTELRLHNFRCFEDHTLPLRDLTVIVGRNNAGKSTIIEALRLISTVVSRYPNLNFVDAPRWLPSGLRFRGVSPDLGGQEFSLDDSVFYHYRGPNDGGEAASVQALFHDGSLVTVYVGPAGQIHATILDPYGRIIVSKAQARNCPLPGVSILPQVAPLERNERMLGASYVRGAMGSHLTPRHFRNQLHALDYAFPVFKELAESSWAKLRIEELGTKGAYPDGEYYLLVRDEDFTAEIGHMGHGLQIWLQVLWYLARTPSDATVILDEPDVYLHADLQRKLIRLLKGRFEQVILATHSVEIMSEVDEDQVLVVDHHKGASGFADSVVAVQRAVNQIGGVHVIQLARLYGSRRCLFVEGDDMGLLKHFQNAMFASSDQPLAGLPNWSTGGWGGWAYALASAAFLENAFGQSIVTHCIMDSDYHTPAQIATRLADAKAHGISLHVWSKKEIENYLLIPSAIRRVINALMCGNVAPSEEEITQAIEDVVTSLRDTITLEVGEELQKENTHWSHSRVTSEARGIVDAAWSTRESRLAIAPGKRVLSALQQWVRSKCQVSFSNIRLAREVGRRELPAEVQEVMAALEDGLPF